jgi:hypothetical protein
MTNIITKEIAMSEVDEQIERIKVVFNKPEIPAVTGSTLQHYCKYLRANLKCPCVLTGIESMGYFAWEERYEFGYGSKRDYQRMRQERGSYKDQYELRTLDNATVEADWDILVQVERIPHRKQFTIPLSELESVDKGTDNHKILNDYTVWYVNWR